MYASVSSKHTEMALAEVGIVGHSNAHISTVVGEGGARLGARLLPRAIPGSHDHSPRQKGRRLQADLHEALRLAARRRERGLTAGSAVSDGEPTQVCMVYGLGCLFSSRVPIAKSSSLDTCVLSAN